jgi:deoxyribonuclease V
MILAVDVHYSNDQAFVAAVSFDTWAASVPANTYEANLKTEAEYVPGQFYKRELPCIFKLLNENALSPEIIVIDGFVFLDKQRKPGLGMHLYTALNGRSRIIGVAKTMFAGIDEDSKLYRGTSERPLFVTAAGMEIEEAKQHIRAMHGDNRIPVLLKSVDRMCRESAIKAMQGKDSRSAPGQP